MNDSIISATDKLVRQILEQPDATERFDVLLSAVVCCQMRLKLNEQKLKRQQQKVTEITVISRKKS